MCRSSAPPSMLCLCRRESRCKPIPPPTHVHQLQSRCSVPDFTAAIEGALVDFNDTIRAVKGKGDAGGKTAS